MIVISQFEELPTQTLWDTQKNRIFRGFVSFWKPKAVQNPMSAGTVVSKNICKRVQQVIHRFLSILSLVSDFFMCFSCCFLWHFLVLDLLYDNSSNFAHISNISICDILSTFRIKHMNEKKRLKSKQSRDDYNCVFTLRQKKSLNAYLKFENWLTCIFIIYHQVPNSYF